MASADLNLWIVVATFLAAFGAIGTGLLTAFFHRKNLEYDSMLKALSILTNDKHRKSRSRIFKAFEKYLEGDETSLSLFKSKEYKDDVELVRSDFADIGVLVYGELDYEIVKEELSKDEKSMKHLDKQYRLPFTRKGALTKNLFLSAYYGSVINCWYALEHIINYERVHNRDEHFMMNFELLFKDALRFKSKHNLGDSRIQKKYKDNKKKLDERLEKIKKKETIIKESD